MTELFSVRACVTSSDWTSDWRIDAAVWGSDNTEKEIISCCQHVSGGSGNGRGGGEAEKPW